MCVEYARGLLVAIAITINLTATRPHRDYASDDDFDGSFQKTRGKFSNIELNKHNVYEQGKSLRKLIELYKNFILFFAIFQLNGGTLLDSNFCHFTIIALPERLFCYVIYFLFIFAQEELTGGARKNICGNKIISLFAWPLRTRQNIISEKRSREIENSDEILYRDHTASLLLMMRICCLYATHSNRNIYQFGHLLTMFLLLVVAAHLSSTCLALGILSHIIMK